MITGSPADTHHEQRAGDRGGWGDWASGGVHSQDRQLHSARVETQMPFVIRKDGQNPEISKELLPGLWPHPLLSLGMLGWDLETHFSASPVGRRRLQKPPARSFPCGSAGLGLARSPQCGSSFPHSS